MESTFFCDSDHAHDQVTRQSLTGYIGYVGIKPLIWGARRQGSIVSSTYAPEFNVLYAAIEEAIGLRYMLRYFGCNVPADGLFQTKIFNDSFSVVQIFQNPAADLSKKHVVISFCLVREAIVTGIVAPY